MRWPSPLLTFLLLIHGALLRKGPLPLDGAAHSQSHLTVWHVGYSLSLKHGHQADFINFVAEITFSVGIQMSCVTFKKSELSIYLNTKSAPRAAKAQSLQMRNGSTWHREKRRKPIKLTGKWEETFSVILDMTDEISSAVHSWLLHSSMQKGSWAFGPLTATNQLSWAFSQLRYVLILSMDFPFCPPVICCSSNPQLGEVPVEMVFFFLNQQDFFFFFILHSLQVVAKTHISLFDLFSVYFILTHRFKKNINSDNKTKVFCYSSLFGLKHLPLCLFAHGKGR